jgi:glutamyl-tRNA reductase
MRVGVVGINHKLANLKLREALAKIGQRRFSPGFSTHGNRHFVLLSTCNRTELYFCSDDLTETHTYLLNIFRNEIDEEFDQKLYSYFGKDCFLHLSRVTAGLDSAIIAETEIQGQVKNAYECSAQNEALPEELHYLFQKSLKVAKKIRSNLLFKQSLPELEHAIFNTGHHFFKDQIEPKILFVGVSEINQKILRFLKSKNLNKMTICNRTREKSEILSQNHDLSILDWSHLSSWIDYDWIIFGTKAPQYLISLSQMKSSKEKLVMDLCVPRNVDPLLARHNKITLLNIDQLNRMLSFRKQRLFHALLKAENYVIKSIEVQTLLFKKKQQYRLNLQAI